MELPLYRGLFVYILIYNIVNSKLTFNYSSTIRHILHYSELREHTFITLVTEGVI